MDKNAKILSAVGALFITISPVVAWIPLINLAGLIGIILFLVGINGIGKYLSKPEVFSESLWAFLVVIIGVVIIAVVDIIAVVLLGGGAILSASFGTAELSYKNLISTAGPALGVVIGISTLVGWILFIIYGNKMSKASELLGESFPNLRFKASAKLFKLGGWLSIVLGVGFLLIWVAWLLYTIDLFSLPES